MCIERSHYRLLFYRAREAEPFNRRPSDMFKARYEQRTVPSAVLADAAVEVIDAIGRYGQ